MKKSLFAHSAAFTVAAFLSSTMLPAQNSSPYWSLAGNSNAAASSKLGTTNAIPLNLTTNNFTRLRIGTDGKVGIGTTSPFTRLHVVGFGSFGNRLTAANTTRALNLVDTAAVMRVLRVHATNAPAIELISRTSADGANVAYWDMYAEPSDKSFRIRDRVTGTNLDRLTITKTGDVGIGTTSPGYQLHVEGGTANTAVYGKTAGPYGVYGTGGTYGVYGKAGSYGIYGESTSTGVYGTGGSYGVEGYAPGGTGFGYGVFGHSSYTGVTGSGGSYGVSGYCTSTSSGYGVYGNATDNPSGIGVYGQGYYGVKAISNTLYGVDGTGYYIGVIGHGSTSNSFSYGTEGYGVYQGGYFTGGSYGVQGYASSTGGTGVYGSTASGGYAGYFNGTVYATTYAGSDRKLKKNIEDVSTALDIINKLHPKAYEFRQDGSYQYMHLPQGKHYGLIAQELEQVLPNLVKDTRFDTRVELQAKAKALADGAPSTRNAAPQGEVIDFKAVNYTELTPILVKAVQELDKKTKEIDELKARIEKLEALLDAKNIPVLSPGKSTLGMVTPNPVRGIARIQYEVPGDATNARLLVTDALGRTVKVVQLGNSGAVNVDVSALGSGVYNYSLVVEGKTVQTRKMTVER